MLPADFRLTLDARVRGRPPARRRAVRDRALCERGRGADPRMARRARRGRRGALARALVTANLAQPMPPPPATPPVTAVIPVRDRSIARVLAALDVAEVIVVDDASRTARRSAPRRRRRRPIRPARAARRRGGGAQRGPGGGDATSSSRCVDSDCVPPPGWLDALLPHFADPELDAVAPRIVALDARPGRERARALRGACAPRSTAAPQPARVIPYGRVPFVPGRRSSSAATCGSTRRCAAARTWSSCGGCRTCATSPRRRSRTSTGPTPRAWLARRAYYGRTAAAIATRHPGKARPLNVSPWTTAAWVGPRARATGDRARDHAHRDRAARARARGRPDPDRRSSSPRGQLRSGRVVADALDPRVVAAVVAAALAFPQARLPLAAAVLTRRRSSSPTTSRTDRASGSGCLEHRDLDALLPARPGASFIPRSRRYFPRWEGAARNGW